MGDVVFGEWLDLLFEGEVIVVVDEGGFFEGVVDGADFALVFVLEDMSVIWLVVS